MKRRGKRFTLAVAAMGLAVTIGLGVFQRSAIRDHFRGWRFLLTQEPMGIVKQHGWQIGETVNVDAGTLEVMEFLGFIAGTTGAQVLIQPSDESLRKATIDIPRRYTAMTAQVAVTILRTNGFDVIELRFPSRQYVVLPDEHGSRHINPDPFKSRFGQ